MGRRAACIPLPSKGVSCNQPVEGQMCKAQELNWLFLPWCVSPLQGPKHFIITNCCMYETGLYQKELAGFLGVLQKLNFCPHAMHCHSQGESLATFAAFHFLSCLEAQLNFHARCLFSFWALLPLQGTCFKIKEGKITLSIEKFHNIYKHHLFHCENSVRY